MISSTPLDQFQVKHIIPLNIAGIDISFSNSALFMMLSSILASIVLIYLSRRKSLYANKKQVVIEGLVNSISNMVSSSSNNKGEKLVPLMICFFVFIFACNILGLTPYSFTATSQIAVTFVLAGTLFVLIVGLGVYNQGLAFFSLFAPKGVPKLMLPLICLVEVFTYLARPLSLGIRLSANMVAGHTMMQVVSEFIYPMGIGGIIPFVFSMVLIAFELFVAWLQAYIFIILATTYLADSYQSH